MYIKSHPHFEREKKIASFVYGFQYLPVRSGFRISVKIEESLAGCRL